MEPSPSRKGASAWRWFPMRGVIKSSRWTQNPRFHPLPWKSAPSLFLSLFLSDAGRFIVTIVFVSEAVQSSLLRRVGGVSTTTSVAHHSLSLSLSLNFSQLVHICLNIFSVAMTFSRSSFLPPSIHYLRWYPQASCCSRRMTRYLLYTRP